MTNSKNPCWFENIGKKDLLRCVPYFYIAGVAECGTSDLMTRLLMHPNVMRGSEKAYHWWDRLRYGASATLRFTREHKRTESEFPWKVEKRKADVARLSTCPTCALFCRHRYYWSLRRHTLWEDDNKWL